MVPGEIGVEVFGGDTAAAAEEGLEPLVAAVDGVEMKLAAAAFADDVVHRLAAETPGRLEDLGQGYEIDGLPGTPAAFLGGVLEAFGFGPIEAGHAELWRQTEGGSVELIAAEDSPARSVR